MWKNTALTADNLLLHVGLISSLYSFCSFECWPKCLLFVINTGSSFGETPFFGATELGKWLRDLRTTDVFVVVWYHLDDPGWILAQFSFFLLDLEWYFSSYPQELMYGNAMELHL